MARGSQRKSGLHYQVINELGMQIVDGEFAEDQRLPSADDLSTTMGVSRTVIREALRVLEEKGLVFSRPKAGIQVQPRSVWKLLDADVLTWHYRRGPKSPFIDALMELRCIVEPAAAALAAERATDEDIQAMRDAYDQMAASLNDPIAFQLADRAFHAAIYFAAGNPLLASVARAFEVDVDDGLGKSAWEPQKMVVTLPTHHKLLEAIAARDPDAAHQAATKVIEQVRSVIDDAIRGSDDGH